MSEPLVIDGSYGEGGGQVIRTSLALSAITGRPIEIFNIRGKRPKPGLQAQHLKSVEAAAAICGAEVKGAKLQSQALWFSPTHRVEAGNYRFDIGTAGSTMLVLQTVFVPLALVGTPSVVTVTGGTHNPMAPCADYLETIFLSAMARMGITSSLSVGQLGFFPLGGGEVVCRIEGAPRLKPIRLEERGDLVERIGRVIVTGLSAEIGERGRALLGAYLGEHQPSIVGGPSLGPGAAVFVASRYSGGYGGFTGLGERRKPMGAVVDEAGLPYRDWEASEATVDEHLADQLVLPAVFADRSSRWRTSEVTDHLRTVVWLVRQFVDREITIDESTGWVEVQ